MTRRKTVLFRLEANPQIGIGHLQRCLSLAVALHRLGTSCVFLANADPIVQKRVADSGFKAERMNGSEPGTDEDLGLVLTMANRHQGEVIVVDSYRVGADYLQGLREAGLIVVAVDDLAVHPFPCQIVVNGSAGAQDLPYVSSSPDTRFLLGSEHILLRPEFWDVPPRMTREVVKNILVILGGADSHNLMPRLLAMLDDLAPWFGVTAVIGPFFANRDEVEMVAKRCRKPVRRVEAPDSVRDLMLEADLAISAGGQTLYELAASGTPTVAVQVADNQSSNLRGLAAEGVLQFAGSVEDAGLVGRVGAAIGELIGNSSARARMSRTGQRLVDGRGAIRLAETIIRLSSR
ncbi:MAG: UDP-2,4-diacetamido-2,4,6-trideoxy-beta-L-altropyranose hydrolase [Chloroflexi bacterium]|nr:UDP-2,4-diacetamido-2,4,6-trideoxy-beta-L-altropyranose hydrolase [Chloroflexota bacterium]